MIKKIFLISLLTGVLNVCMAESCPSSLYYMPLRFTQIKDHQAACYYSAGDASRPEPNEGGYAVSYLNSLTDPKPGQGIWKEWQGSMVCVQRYPLKYGEECTLN